MKILRPQKIFFTTFLFNLVLFCPGDGLGRAHDSLVVDGFGLLEILHFTVAEALRLRQSSFNVGFVVIARTFHSLENLVNQKDFLVQNVDLIYKIIFLF